MINKRLTSIIGISSLLSILFLLSSYRNSDNRVRVGAGIEQSSSVQVTIQKTSPTNGQSNGSITLQVVKGVAPLTLTVFSTHSNLKNIPFSGSYTLSNLPSGDYLLVITDATKAFVSEQVTL